MKIAASLAIMGVLIAQPVLAKFAGCTINHQVVGAPSELDVSAEVISCFENSWEADSGRKAYVAAGARNGLEDAFRNGQLGIMITAVEAGEIRAIMNSAAAMVHEEGEEHINFATEPLFQDGKVVEVARMPSTGYAGENLNFDAKGEEAAISFLREFTQFSNVAKIVPDMPATTHMISIKCP